MNRNGIKRIAVFCGSSYGTEAVYAEQAKELGRALAKRGIGLVYGGAKVGLMGAVADGALEENGDVIGVLPYFLQAKEIAHERLTRLVLVESMHERKTKMNEWCDGIIALPGGFGTMEEFFEMLTWAQLGLHQKPVALLNIDGFYDSLNDLLDVMVTKGFLKETNRRMLLTGSSIDDLLQQMQTYSPPDVAKWISKDKV